MTACARCTSSPTLTTFGVGGQVDLGDVARHQLGAEALGLGAHVVHELRALDALGEAGEVLDLGGRHQRAAELRALEHQRVQVGARGVDGGGVPGRAGPDDDQVADAVVLGRRDHRAAISRRSSRRGRGVGWELVTGGTTRIVGAAFPMAPSGGSPRACGSDGSSGSARGVDGDLGEVGREAVLDGHQAGDPHQHVPGWSPACRRSGRWCPRACRWRPRRSCRRRRPGSSPVRISIVAPGWVVVDGDRRPATARCPGRRRRRRRA